MGSSLVRGWPRAALPARRRLHAEIFSEIATELALLETILATSHSIRQRKAARRRMAILRAARCGLQV